MPIQYIHNMSHDNKSLITHNIKRKTVVRKFKILLDHT